MVNDIISRSLSTAGYPTISEPAYVTDNVRPDGITKSSFYGGKSLAWDVTFLHLLCSSYLHIAKTKSAVANSCENKKRTKYAALMSKYEFAPIAIESFGSYGDSAIDVIRLIGKKLNQRFGDQKASSQLRQKISLTLQKGNAAIMKFSL